MSERLAWVWRRLWLLPVLLLLVGFGYAVFMTEAGRFVSRPVDAPVPADLVASLGGGADTRTLKALALVQGGYAPRIFLTGPVDGRQQLLLDRGLPASAVLLDGRSAHSWDEAMNTYRLMLTHGWRSVLVVSDPPHMRRLAWTWEHVFVGSGLSFHLIPAPMPAWDPDHWWRQPWSKAYVEKELEKLMYYLFRYGSEGPQFDLPVWRH